MSFQQPIFSRRPSSLPPPLPSHLPRRRRPRLSDESAESTMPLNLEDVILDAMLEPAGEPAQLQIEDTGPTSSEHDADWSAGLPASPA